MFDIENPATTMEECPEALPPRSSPQAPRRSLINHQNIVVVKKLSKAKFPVYLVASQIDHQNYAMKVFSHSKGAPSLYFQNEARFASLKHPNIINTVHHEDSIEVLSRNEVKKTSYIMMEYAPHDDFFNFIMAYQNKIDEKLIRTYFRQMIEGIEYLHQNRVAHLDLKPENLLLGADFNLKIADFDLSYVHGDSKVISRGTKCYRAPELYKSCSGSDSVEARLASLLAADIYSAGIILFIFKSGGVYPHCEDQKVKGIDLENLMYTNNEEFWKVHCEIEGKQDSFYDAHFRELFNDMVKFNPFERSSIEKIKDSQWYKGPVYNPEELQEKMEKMLCPLSTACREKRVLRL